MMNDDITIGDILPGEEEAACGLIMRMFEEFIAPDYGTEGRKTFMRFVQPGAMEERIRSGESFVLTAKRGERIIGVIEVSGASRIRLFDVDRDSMRRGIGRRLLDAALVQCREADPAVSALTVNSSPFAVPVYERLGFAKAGERTERDGIVFFPMRRDLKVG